ncbi:MAG: DUF4836 family protein [Bacteroidota bacterium]
MNSPIKVTLFGFFFAILSIFACQNEDQSIDQALHAVPTNSTVVTAFDLPTLMRKANFAAVQQMEFYQFFQQKAQAESDMLATVFTHPENAGIDLTQNAYLSIELNPDNPEDIYTGVIFNLTSEKDFAAFANALKGAELDERGNYKLVELNESTQIAWNERIGVIILGEEIYENQEVVDAFFTPATDNSLADNPDLAEVLAQKHDVTTWLTSNALAQNKSAKLALSLAKIKPEAINDNFVHGFVDFEPGKVNAQLDFFFQKDLIEDVNLLFKEKVRTDFTPYIDGSNLNIFVTAALSFDGLHQALNKRSQVKMFVDFALKSYGLSIKKLKDALDGDMVFATYTGNVNNRQEGLFAIKLNQTATFEAILAIAEDNELVTKTGRGRYLVSPSLNKMLSSFLPMDLGSEFDNQLIIHEDIAFLSGNINRLDAIENGTIAKTDQIPQNIQAIANENPIGILVDFNSMKRVGVPLGIDLDEIACLGNQEGVDFQLTMKNKKVNSLQAIFEAINREFLKTREQKQPVSQEKS